MKQILTENEIDFDIVYWANNLIKITENKRDRKLKEIKSGLGAQSAIFGIKSVFNDTIKSLVKLKDYFG